MTQAELLDRFMNYEWEYPDFPWDDARECARVMGGKPTGTIAGPDPDDLVEWLMPDGSTIWINHQGTALQLEK